MSCALRALKKAKALIREVTSLGVISFMARVAGKVPLDKDPDKKKQDDGKSVQNMRETSSNDKKMKESILPSQDSPSEDCQSVVKDPEVIQSVVKDPEVSQKVGKDPEVSQNVGKDPEVSQNQPQSGSTDTGSDKKDHTLGSESNKSQNVSEKKHTGKELCKLKEALTLDSPVSETSTVDVEPSVMEENPHKSETDCGLKIVASFSLHNMEHHESDAEKRKTILEEVIQPNFFLSTPVEKEQILSFLGPDRPVFKSSDNSCTAMLPPPPLQPSPFHLPVSTHQAAGSGLKSAVKNSNFFVCGFNCLFSSLGTNDFLEHTMNIHSTETYFPCFYCGHRSPNEADLVRHISNHTHTHSSSLSLYVCGNSGCRFGTNMMGDYITHIKTSHSDILEPMCYSCGDTFSEASMLQAHVEDNVIHIVNCPHCSSKATDRKTILTHISSAHPGKPKMVSVAKQLICYDRKINNYQQIVHLREMLPPALTPAPFATGASVSDQMLKSHELPGEKITGRLLPDVNTLVSSLSPRDVQMSASEEMPLVDRLKAATPESGKSPASESSDFETMRVKEEVNEEAEESGDGAGEDSRSAYIVDENGIRRRLYVPMSERKAENYRCKHCTFIARDSKRMHCHEKSHGMPPTKKERFKCMFCPQGFDSELKFRLHITCHPGLIKFLLYRCKKCEFDSNQKHIIVRHITCNRDRKHRGFGPLEDQYTVVSRSLESRVLECERCDYMTRHKIHMTIHYQRMHNILKDKADFTIENLMPTDTPVASPAPSHGAPSPSSSSSSLFKNLSSPGSFPGDSFDFTKPSASAKNSKSKSSSDSPVFTPAQIVERNEIFNRMVSQQAALQSGHIMENQMRKFKCPICKYLLPKAADLKNHVKRHSEIGQITLVMFRCRYCSCMSTARELLYEHLVDKHPGKSIALVKKIVVIDTADVDKSFAETSVEESLDQLEESLQKEMMSTLNSGSPVAANGLSSSYEQIFVLPEGEETFTISLQCPRCSYSSYVRSDIVDHIKSLHPEVQVIGGDEDIDNFARASEGLPQKSKTHRSRLDSQEDVLILPDDQVFNEPTLCSRCDFATMFRKDMVDHLQQNHPEISVMGHKSYPVQASAIEQSEEPTDESCVVGSASLDAKLRCLYENYGTQMKCLICGTERPKKFFIHVHILRHLNIYLWKCTFCPHRGLQKYKMIDHIKKIHPGKPLSVRYLRVDVEDKVSLFLSQFNVIKNRKASLDEGSYVPFASDELSDQASSDSSRSRQRSPGPGNDSSCAHSLGSEELDAKISCMYDNFNDVQFKCRVCPSQFRRKFAMHRHIIISHLKVALLSCAYCGMEGVERHQLVDHILTCHKPAPISILNLDIDLYKMASDFLAKMAAKAQNGSYDTSYSGISEGSSPLFSNSDMGEEGDYNQNSSFNPNTKLKFGSMKYNKFMKPPTFRFGNKVPGTSNLKTNRKVDPDVVMLGRHALDKKLSCLYQERPTGQLRCLVCRWEFPRKYPLHRHIMLKHLKLSLVGCPYCPFEGIEKYNVTTHVREEHKDKPINIKFTQPDVETRVRQFVDNMANIGGTGHEDLIQKPQSKRQLMQAASKLVKQSDDEMDNNDDNDDDEDENEEKNGGRQRTPHGGLVVAMFGKKKQSCDKDIIVKTEVDEEQMEEGSALQTNNEEFNDYKREEELVDDKTSFEFLDSDSCPVKYSPGSSYVPGFYRSPAGGKAKALDVITKIKVLKSKEGPIMKYYCEKCKFTSLHRSNIVRHIYKIHEKYQTHTCPTCHYQTLSPMLMERHLEKAHQDDRTKEDSHAQKSFSKSFMGMPIVKRKKKSTPIKRPEVKTEDSNSYTGPKHYACAYCYYETNTQADILQHTRDNHSQGDSSTAESKSSPAVETSTAKSEDASSACWDGSKKAVKRKWQDEEEGVYKRKRRFIFEKGNELIQCGHCEIKETSMSRMQDHITWDHPGLLFQAKQIPAWRFLCKSCSVKTMATSKMKYHLNRHISYRPYTCVTCGAFFPSPDQCRRHSRSQAHEEQYTYVRNPKKEAKVEELLEATRQLALKVQEEAVRNPDFDMTQADNFISKFQDSKSNLKKNLKGSNSKQSKKAAAAAAAADFAQNNQAAAGEPKAQKKQHGKSPQVISTEQEVTIKCYYCEYTSSNVSSVNIHHKETHPGKKFLWTEIERGFTCDSTGEALVDCDSVPGASMDVGYTTRMTLSSGSNTMRFKCKTCDFSSFVIQAMKSHLKSHQPKGFICPYCSRSFSGKEKLMRHQYCLHKGQPLWVIHLRRSGVVGATSVKKGKGVSEEDSASTVQEDTTLEDDDEANSSDKLARTSQAAPTTYVCNECSFSSESLYHFRRHLAQKHQESKRKGADNSFGESSLKCSYCPFLAETEADFDSHTETHLSIGSFLCGYCDYTAPDRSGVQQHLATDHGSLEPKFSEMSARESKSCLDRKERPLLLNLKPKVAVERIPDSVLTQYGYQTSEADTSSDNDDNDNEESTLASGDQNSQKPVLFEEPQSESSNDDRLMPAEETSQLSVLDNEESNSSQSSNHSVRANDQEDNFIADNFDINLNVPTDSDELARELGLVEDETSCVLGSDADMMIMQFGGIVDKGDDLPEENIHSATLESEEREHDKSVPCLSPDVQGSSSFCSKDSTLFAAQENGEDDDDDDSAVTFDNDIMLASPLPMISLGDDVSVSPLNVESKVNNISSLSLGNSVVAMDVDTCSEVLLDI
ncbi:unnamed protein product [Candidula unifasciata]|uniref:C2H2-type domain-containing protein n=1 Tax=Candidula unifasciata TaxID=100452 RepID=A0A8S4A258_9EUPU|nr:unnamed protein product [Candidula unifasciata]